MSHARLAIIPLLASWLPAQRELDPVVVTGADVPQLLGYDPDEVVGFSHDGGWRQIPVQIDERAVVNLRQVRQNTLASLNVLVYTDNDTYTGADPDTGFDADDELVLMAVDAGDPAGFGDPAGVVPGTRVGLAVDDPLGGPDRYVYLYLSDGTLDPAAGEDRVSYTFDLLSGDYQSTYVLGDGLNPEDSVVVTDAYQLHFSDRWILDDLSITAPGASGADILDRHKFYYEPGSCLRTTFTFSEGGGAFIANIDGPVRAIRSVVGANSGTYTQRDWKFYQARTDVVTNLRVHPIDSAWTFVDYGPGASGMAYYDNLNGAGTAVDGVPDTMASGILTWQLVTGAQGSLVTSLELMTDAVGLTQTSHYFDDLAPNWTQCTGDPWAYAAAGARLLGLPNTDPAWAWLFGSARKLDYHRTLYFEAPGVTSLDAALRAAAAKAPLGVHRLQQYELFGEGCQGSAGIATLRATGVFEIGGEAVVEISGLPAAQPGALFFGFSDQVSGGQPLPVDLGFLGAVDCTQYASLDLAIAAGSGSGTVQVVFQVPPDPSLIGTPIFNQYASLDPGANAAGLITSNAGKVVIGTDL